MSTFDPAAATSIGRPLDPGYPTNRAVLLLLPVGAGLGAWLAGPGLLEGALAGAGSTFLAWALTRELAPDLERTAFIAWLLAALALAGAPDPALLPAAALLLATRVVNRTVGPPARLLDAAAVVAAALWATAAYPGGWTVGAAAALAFALDLRPPDPGPRRHAVLAGGLTAAAVLAAWREPGGGAVPPSWVLIAGGVVAAYGVALVRTRRLHTVADRTGAPLSAARVRRAMAVPLAVALPSLAGVGLPLPHSAPLWAALAAASVGALVPGTKSPRHP